MVSNFQKKKNVHIRNWDKSSRLNLLAHLLILYCIHYTQEDKKVCIVRVCAETTQKSSKVGRGGPLLAALQLRPPPLDYM